MINSLCTAGNNTRSDTVNIMLHQVIYMRYCLCKIYLSQHLWWWISTGCRHEGFHSYWIGTLIKASSSFDSYHLRLQFWKFSMNSPHLYGKSTRMYVSVCQTFSYLYILISHQSSYQWFGLPKVLRNVSCNLQWQLSSVAVKLDPCISHELASHICH